jgi:hypothetical protein
VNFKGFRDEDGVSAANGVGLEDFPLLAKLAIEIVPAQPIIAAEAGQGDPFGPGFVPAYSSISLCNFFASGYTHPRGHAVRGRDCPYFVYFISH